MTEEVKGLRVLHKAIENAWNENYQDIKDEFRKNIILNAPTMHDVKFVSHAAEDAAEDLNLSGYDLDSAGIIGAYYDEDVDVSKGFIEQLDFSDPREGMDGLVKAIVYEQTKEIFHERFKESKIEWEKEIKDNAPKGPGM